MKKPTFGAGEVFAAYAAQIIEDEDGKYRLGVEFHAIPLEAVAPFLDNDETVLRQENLEPGLREALGTYFEKGVDSREFALAKLQHLGNIDDFRTCYCYFDNEIDALSIELYSWYSLTEDGEIYVLFENPVTEESSETTCSLEPFEDAANELLHKLHRTVEFPARNRVRAIQPTTVFHSFELCYVGAALCVPLWDAVQDPILGTRPNNVVGFFDFGIKTGATSSKPAIQAQVGTAIASRDYIDNILANYPAQTIIISHWHMDHISLGFHFANNAQFWAQSDWYYPETTDPAAAVFLASLNQHGGGSHPFNNVFPANVVATPINGNANLNIAKIDAFDRDAATAGSAHPHHHGIFATMTMASGRTAFFSGDCTYSGIPAAFKGGSNYLQASHHGGEYAVAPAHRAPADIPSPAAAAGATRMVLYSANGTTHGHPAGYSQTDHSSRGWNSWASSHLFTAAGISRIPYS